MLLISNVIAALSTFYRSEELRFLFSLPLTPERVFPAKMFENTFYSSWATLLLALPIVVAYLTAFELPFLRCLLTIPALLGFIAIPAGIGVSILLILRYLFPFLNTRDVIFILLGILGLPMILFLATNPSVFRVPKEPNLVLLNQYLEHLYAMSPYLPSTWFVRVLEGNRVWLHTLLLVVGGIASVSLSFVVKDICYRRGVMMGAVERSIRRIKARMIVGGGMLGLTAKEIVLFFRNPLQWAQSLIVVGLLGVYLVNLKTNPFLRQDPFWTGILTLTNIAFISYLSATMSVRFVYPAMSLEDGAFWFLLSSPVPRVKVLFAKILGNMVMAVPLVGLLTYTSGRILLLPFAFVVFTTVLMVVVSAALAVLSVCLGAVFANFGDDNPSRLASGGGGAITAVFCLGYVFMVVMFLLAPVREYVRKWISGAEPVLGGDFVVAGCGVIVLSVLVVLFSLYWALRSRRWQEC